MDEEIAQLERIYDQVVDIAVNYSFQIMAAVLILVVGYFVGRGASKFVLRICEARNFDITLTRFFAGLVKVTVIVFAVIIALAKFGITIAPMVAAIGAGAFGLTLAIQGPISNYGAGLALILTRPFKVGDTLTLHGLTGVVENISLATTVLINEDGEEITIPNRKVVGEIYVNSFASRLVDGSVGIAYGSDPEMAVKTIRGVLEKHAEVAKDPVPNVGIAGFGDSSINIAYRYWARTQVYYRTLQEINLSVFQALKQAGIAIPFPQREVRLLESNKKEE